MGPGSTEPPGSHRAARSSGSSTASGPCGLLNGRVRPLTPPIRPHRLYPPPADLAGVGDLLPGAARVDVGRQLRPAGHLWRDRAGPRPRLVSPLRSLPRQLRPLPGGHLPEDRLAVAVDGDG